VQESIRSKGKQYFTRVIRQPFR